MIRARFDAVGKHEPEKVAVGKGGFDGYVAFLFPKRGICLLESAKVNNATYVLKLDSWKALSQRSKAQILDEKAHESRIIHNRQWFDELDKLMR